MTEEDFKRLADNTSGWVIYTSKIVKCITDHKTTYLKYKHNYETVGEFGNFYQFKFGDELVMYPKFYFIDVREQDTK